MNQTQTLGRALDILFVLADSKTTLSVSEIARKVPIPESTAYRLIKTLEQNEIIERKSTGQISLGMRILDLARTLYEQIDRNLLEIARPKMDELTNKINETSLLVVRRGEVGISVQHVEGNRLIGFVVKNGRTQPLHLGASGKAILAFEDEKFIKKVITGIDEKYHEKLIQELKIIREEGYVKTIAEVDSDILGVAAPIFDEYNRVIASLSIVGPKDRFDEKDIKESIIEVVRAAQEITKLISEISMFIR